MKKSQAPKSQNVREIAEEVSRLTGQSIEEILEQLPSQEEVDIDETDEEAMFVAQSVLNYYYAYGNGFYHRPCKKCGRRFAYAYSYPGVAYCSIKCAKAALADIGIMWDHTKTLRERWGAVMPAIVPPEALELMKEAKHQEVCPAWKALKANQPLDYEKQRRDFLERERLMRQSRGLPVAGENETEDEDSIIEAVENRSPRKTKTKQKTSQTPKTSASRPRKVSKANTAQPPKSDYESLLDAALDELFLD